MLEWIKIYLAKLIY